MGRSWIQISRWEILPFGWPWQRPSCYGSHRARPNASTTISARRCDWWCNKLHNNTTYFLVQSRIPTCEEIVPFNFVWHPYREATRGSGSTVEQQKIRKLKAKITGETPPYGGNCPKNCPKMAHEAPATKPPQLWPFWKTIQNGSKRFLQHLDHLPKPAGFGNCKDEVNLWRKETPFADLSETSLLYLFGVQGVNSGETWRKFLPKEAIGETILKQN